MPTISAKNLFTEDEKKRIEAAIQKAEARTSGEIVPMIVDQSYDYNRAEIIGSGFFSLATAVLASWAFGHSSVWVFLPVFLALYFPFKMLIRALPELKRKLIPAHEIDEEIEEKALISFLQQGINHTRDETGILILISLFERRVFVLADRGINKLVEQNRWDEIVQIITEGLRKNQACDAICNAIERCGDLLETNFPVKEDDTNELPDLIIE